MSNYVRKVVPMLVCLDPAAEIEFCKAAFGAVELSLRSEENGAVVHATLGIGEILVMLHGETEHLASRAPQQDGSSPVVIYLYLEDVDTVIERALAAGARVLTPLADQFWGDRMARIVDPAGHVWNVASRVEEGPKTRRQ
jgi:PhnB protein